MATQRPKPGQSTRNRLLAAVATAALLGFGLIVLQRWVAATFQAAVALSAVWFVLVAITALIVGTRRRELRAPMLATLAVLAIASVAVGYVTTFRKDTVDEDVVTAGARASSEVRMVSLRADTDVTPEPEAAPPERTGPVELAEGSVSGADGHAGEGKATVISSEDGDRVLTLTGFEVDAGPDVDVYLSETTAGIDDAVRLGDLKGEIGDQQYEIPASVDLTKYDGLVLFCIPFTTRIATAELR